MLCMNINYKYFVCWKLTYSLVKNFWSVLILMNVLVYWLYKCSKYDEQIVWNGMWTLRRVVGTSVGVHMLEREKWGIEVMEYQGSFRFWQVGKQGESCRIWIPPPPSETDHQNKRRNFEHYCRKTVGMDCMTYCETKKMTWPGEGRG